MGQYATCWLESLYVGATKNNFADNLMQLFRASDKRAYKCAEKDLPRPMLPATDHAQRPDTKIDVVYYTAPALLVKDRLELKGYTLETAKRAFMKIVRADLREYSRATAPYQNYYQTRLRILQALDIDQWISTLRDIKESGLGGTGSGIPRWAFSQIEKESTLKDFMLQNDWYGYSGVDLNVPLRLALEICTETDNFVYDLTDLVSAGYFKKNEDFVALASEFDGIEHASRSRTIILTEGSSDARIISESMKLLYPHLSDYFTFMDFDAAKVEGGASQLARIVKSFIGAGIVNRVIALFDNDAAGQEAIKSLSTITLPGHFRVLKLPDLRELRKYPTVGPSGRTIVNVNGLAASIELYLGEDVLRLGGKLTPVQWSAYNSATGKYQGEVQGKRDIHERFKKKLLSQKDCADLIHDPNWVGLRTIMSSIFSAFHPYDRKLILSEQWENYDRD